MKFRAVFLDIDDTLFDFRKTSFEALVTAFAEIGVSFTEADMPHYEVYNNRMWEMFERGEIEKEHIYEERFRLYFAERGIEAEIHTIEGSVEIAPAVGLSDAIFDIVSSGGTLVSNGLREVETVLRSEAALIACPSLDADKRSQTEQLVFRFRSIRESRDMKYVLMNLPVEKVAEATALLPGMRSPTILPLAQEGWCSLHAVIGKAQLWERIERLKAIGAEGILVLALENMIR